MTKGCIKVDALIEWIEDKYFECEDDSVNHVVDEIIEKVREMENEDPPAPEPKPDFFEDFLQDSLIEEEWNE